MAWIIHVLSGQVRVLRAFLNLKLSLQGSLGLMNESSVYEDRCQRKVRSGNV